MLGIKEKITLQKAVKSNLNALKAGVQNIREKITIQRSIKEALSKLRGSSKPAKTLLERFLSGEFIKETPAKFLSMVMKVLPEVDGNVQNIIEPIINFADAHRADMIFESAQQLEFDINRNNIAEILYNICGEIERTGRKGTLTISIA